MAKKKRKNELPALAKSWERALRAGISPTRKERKSASKHTIHNYLKTLSLLAAHLDEHELPATVKTMRVGDLDDWITLITDRTSAANAGHHYRNLVAFWAWVVKVEKMVPPGKNPMLEVPAPYEPQIKRPPLSHDQGHRVNHKRVERLMRAVGLQGIHLRRKIRTTVPEPSDQPSPTCSAGTSPLMLPTAAMSATCPPCPPSGRRGPLPACGRGPLLLSGQCDRPVLAALGGVVDRRAHAHVPCGRRACGRATRAREPGRRGVPIRSRSPVHLGGVRFCV